MIPKPPACAGCPLYAGGAGGFVPDELIKGAEVMIVGQNPGAEEEAQGIPFVGKTGSDMERIYFPRAGLQRGRVSLGNAIRCRWRGTNDLPPLESEIGRAAVVHCTRSHFHPLHGVTLLVAQGGYALYALTGESKISEWRGWVLPQTRDPSGIITCNQVYNPFVTGERSSQPVPVLATGHLASLYKTGRGSATDKGAFLTNTTAFRTDWGKIPRILKREWPQPLPPIASIPPRMWPDSGAFDTEYNRYTKELYRYSLAWRSAEGSPTVHVVEAHLALGTPKALSPYNAILHNAPADLRALVRIAGPVGRVDDTLYMHSVLWPDLPHDLDFLASLYARTNRWKHLVETNPTQYAGGDALGTWDLYTALCREYAADPRSRAVYEEEQLPLLPIIARATGRGLRVHGGRVEEAGTDLKAQSEEARLLAEASVGWPLNVDSPLQVGLEIYDRARIR